MNWKFELKHRGRTLEIEEPIGWDKVSFKIQKDLKTYGMQFEFSTDLEFYNDAAELITILYDTYSIEANIELLVYEDEGTEFYLGKLVLKSARFTTGAVKCKVEQVSFARTFKSKRKIKVQLKPKLDITMQAQSLLLVTTGKHDKINNHANNLNFIFEKSDLDIKGSQFKNEVERSYLINLRVKGIVLSGEVKIRIQGYLDNGITTYYISDPIGLDGTFDHEVNIKILLPPGTLYISVVSTTADVNIDSNVKLDSDNTVLRIAYIEENNKTSSCQGILLKDAFKAIVQSVTGKDAFKSDFLEKNKVMLTSGAYIRNAHVKKLFVSFDMLYNDIKKLYNLGLEITEDTVRIEPIGYFYNTKKVISFDNINALKRYPAEELFYNEVISGYQSWKAEGGLSNSVFEFNANHQYNTKVTALENPLNIVLSKIVTSGYMIEQLRRTAYSAKDKSKTNKTDELLFLIVLNDALDKNATNENFKEVLGIVSPETTYNLDLSPIHQIIRWAPILACAAVKNKTLGVYRLSSHEGSTNLHLTMKNDKTLKENADIFVLGGNAIFEAEFFEFEYPIKFKDFLTLKQHNRGYIEFSIDGVVLGGYLIELTYKPNEGVGSFKLIKRNKDTKKGIAFSDAAIDTTLVDGIFDPAVDGDFEQSDDEGSGISNETSSPEDSFDDPDIFGSDFADDTDFSDNNNGGS